MKRLGMLLTAIAVVALVSSLTRNLGHRIAPSELLKVAEGLELRLNCINLRGRNWDEVGLRASIVNGSGQEKRLNICDTQVYLTLEANNGAQLGTSNLKSIGSPRTSKLLRVGENLATEQFSLMPEHDQFLREHGSIRVWGYLSFYSGRTRTEKISWDGGPPAPFETWELKPTSAPGCRVSIPSSVPTCKPGMPEGGFLWSNVLEIGTGR